MTSKSARLRITASCLLLPYLIGSTGIMQAQACSGVQAGNEKTNGSPPQNLWLPPNQTFHVNIDALKSSLTAGQVTDIVNGIKSWAGTNGLTLTFDSSAPGTGVVTVQLGSGFSSDGDGQALYGTTGAAANQITGGKITFQPGYQFSCSTGTCPAYDPNAPNADSYLTGLAAHEMGHVLGLDDTSDAGSCSATSTSVMGGQCGTNNNGDGMSGPVPTATSPTSCDKQNVSSQSAATGAGSGSGGSAGGGYAAGGDDSDIVGYYYDPVTGQIVDVEIITVNILNSDGSIASTTETWTTTYSDGSSSSASFTFEGSSPDGSSSNGSSDSGSGGTGGSGTGDGGSGSGTGDGGGTGGGGGGDDGSCDYSTDPCTCDY